MTIDEFQPLFWQAFPVGSILSFAGNLGQKPQGWEVCDGNNGTVNLTDRIPIGWKPGTGVGQANEGSATHTHDFNGGTSQPSGVDNNHVVQDGGSPLTVKGTDHTHTYGGTTTPASSLPPVTRIYFIQKVR